MTGHAQRLDDLPSRLQSIFPFASQLQTILQADGDQQTRGRRNRQPTGSGAPACPADAVGLWLRVLWVIGDTGDESFLQRRARVDWP